MFMVPFSKESHFQLPRYIRGAPLVATLCRVPWAPFVSALKPWRLLCIGTSLYMQPPEISCLLRPVALVADVVAVMRAGCLLDFRGRCCMARCASAMMGGAEGVGDRARWVLVA